MLRKIAIPVLLILTVGIVVAVNLVAGIVFLVVTGGGVLFAFKKHDEKLRLERKAKRKKELNLTNHSDGTTEPAYNPFAKNNTMEAPLPTVANAEEKSNSKPRTDEPSQAWGWVPIEDSRKIQGMTIPGGFYFGKGLPDFKKTDTEPSLITPDSPISDADDGVNTDYWPTYESLTPSQKRKWLKWAEGGYSDSDIDLGFAFIRFYAFERHVIFDNASDDELESIRMEIVRMLGLFGGKRAFHKYGTKFLDVVETLLMKDDDCDDIGIQLAKMAYFKKPILADMGLKWIRNDTNLTLPAVAKKQQDFYDRAFEHLFNKRFPKGMTFSLDDHCRKEFFDYQPASPGFGKNVSIPIFTKFPAIKGIPEITNVLQTICDDAGKILEAFSKAGGLENGKDENILLVPIWLWDVEQKKRIAVIRKEAQTTKFFTNYSEIAMRLTGKDELPPAKLIALSERLGEAGLQSYPDPRKDKTDKEDTVLIFQDDRKPSTIHPVRSAILVEIGKSETGDISEDAADALHEELSPQCAADFAIIDISIATKLETRKVGKYIKDLSTEERNDIAISCVNVALADGAPNHEKVAMLEDLFEKMGTPNTELYSMLHSGKIVRNSVQDDASLSNLRQETKQVESLLSSIFAGSCEISEEQPIQIPAEPENSHKHDAELVMTDNPLPNEEASSGNIEKPKLPRLRGLDEHHSALVLEMKDESSMSLETFARKAGEHGLFPAGALETINDKAWDEIGRPLTEGDDPIEIDQEAILDFIDC